MKDANGRELKDGDLVSMTFQVTDTRAGTLVLQAVSPITGITVDRPPIRVTSPSELTLYKPPAE